MKQPTTMIRTLLDRAAVAASLVLLALPVASRADQHGEAAMDSCIDLFVATNVPKEQPVKVRKLASPESLMAPGRRHRVMLTATGATSGKQLAKGECVVDHRGRVVSFNGKSISAEQLAAATREHATR
jgi:hypothetical protein